MVISFTKVKLPFGWLGNMAPYPIELNGRVWRTTEALFQAFRFADGDPIRDLIFVEKSPMAAKMVAKSNRAKMVVEPMSPPDLELMRVVLRLKVEQHPHLISELLNTGNNVIVEDSSNRQNTSGLFWGAAKQADGSWVGENTLGKLWMELRSELASGVRGDAP